MTILKQYLVDASISQDDFAKAILKTQATVSRIADGKLRPGISLAFVIERETNGAVPAESWVQSEGSVV